MNLSDLRAANLKRQSFWDPEGLVTPLYRSNEMGGEVGEAMNVVKKLEREKLGIRGSRDTVEHLAQELADIIICADLVAMEYDIDLGAATREKFNATSDAVGIDVKL